MATGRKLVSVLWRALRWPVERWKLTSLIVTLLLTLAVEGPPPGLLSTQVNRLLAGRRFNFVDWELNAVVGKLTHAVIAPQRYMDESVRREFFLDYLRRMNEMQRLDWEIQKVYADPGVEDPDAETARLRIRLAELRAAEDARQQIAEAILEEQTACILVHQRFGWLGQEFPPVRVHFTPLPLLLVISPRDHIERIHSLFLRHGLGVAQREAVEEQVDTSQTLASSARVNSPQTEVGELSSLVTGIGGLSAYPAMLLESSSLNWVAEVTAHEWTHHYLTPWPLGWHYGNDPETRTINETVASIVGRDIGRAVVARYYPEFLPPESVPEETEEEGSGKPSEGEDPAAFDFRAEMRETRIRVDELLAEGKIEEAEAYMELRRQKFVDNGYYIRKLNQAYFAFHGAYADRPGAAGADPIGPAVREVYVLSPDLHTFVNRVASVTTLAELEVLLRELKR